METFEKAYSPKEISITLGVGDSTLRKWCIALEKNGYNFIRNDQNNRVYVDSDLVVLKHFQNLVKQHNMQLENAAILVVDRFGKGAFESVTGIVPSEKTEEQRDFSRSSEEVISQLLEHIKHQDEFNQKLIKRLDQQQKYIDERLNRLDERQKERDNMLLESLRASQETKQLLLEAKTAEEQKKPRKGIMRFFGRE
ncbi:MerR family transcriptional regulator [Cytobacillus oceanisediminis]|uniref:MerR family transcriptional regulator n=1 Tax=Cytobacillus oceanisediminis TaxID=665099 RepID=UPI0011A30E53|nr:MerR family transcriptional regulator [Cytobacillus oceanisediminis]